MVIACIINLIEILKYYLVLKYFIGVQERKSKFYVAFSLIGMFAFSWIAASITDNMFIIFTVYIILELFMIFDISIARVTLIGTWLLFFVSTLDVVFSMLIEIVMNRINPKQIISESALSCVSGLFTIIFIVVLIMGMEKLTGGFKLKFSIKFYAYLTLLSIVEGVTIAVYREMLNRWGIGGFTYFLGMLLILMLLLNIFMVVALAVSKDGYKKMNEMNVEHMKMQEKQYRYMQNINSDIRGFKHDFSKHMTVLRANIEQENYIDAKRYLDNILENTHVDENNISVGNAMADVIINQYFYEANEKKVKFSVKGRFDGECSISPYDICVIFSNMLENAMEAACLCEDRYITISINDRQDFVEIMTINSFVGNRNKRDGKYYTTKNDEKNHGLGLKNIITSVNKYSGECNMYDEKGMFVIYINIKK